MAEELERLVVSLEAQTVKYERAMQRALGQTNTAMKRIETRVAQTQVKVGNSFASLGSVIGKGLTVAAGTVALKAAAELIDANSRITNSLKVAGLEGEDLSRVYDQLAVSAKRNGTSFEALASLYGRAALVQKELGVSTTDLTKFVDNVALALRVAGTDSQAASGALTQLSQALGSGVVHAEEFSSILEGAPTIAQAAARGITEAGGSVAKLRQLVIAGKVSSDVFFRGFQIGAAGLEQQASGTSLTISQAMENLQTTLIQAAGKFDRATGAGANFADTLDQVAKAIDQIADSRIVGWLSKLDSALSDSGFLQLGDSLQEIERILKLVDQGAGALEDSFNGAAASADDAIARVLGFETAAAAPSEVKAKIEELAGSLKTGATDADTLRAALVALGASNLNLSIQIADIMALGDAARATGAAVAAVSGRTANDNITDQRAEQALTRAPLQTVSVTDSNLPPKPPSGGGRRSPEKSFNESLQEMKQRIANMNEETSLLAKLGPMMSEESNLMHLAIEARGPAS